MTCSLYQIPYFEITCAPKHALPDYVFRGVERRSVGINAARQGQPKHSNTWLVRQYHAGVTYLRYTVLKSPNKEEAAVHCCDPALSVLVMLVSRNVFHVDQPCSL